ncbi:MAG: hypothetical protein AAGD28_22405 [Bacteroidota bacterium]
MLGIIIVIMLARAVGKRAVDKGLNRNLYWFYSVLAWYGGQYAVAIIVGIIYYVITDQEPSELSLTFIGLAGGALCYYLLYRYVDNYSSAGSDLDLEMKIHELGKDSEEENRSSF